MHVIKGNVNATFFEWSIIIYLHLIIAGLFWLKVMKRMVIRIWNIHSLIGSDLWQSIWSHCCLAPAWVSSTANSRIAALKYSASTLVLQVRVAITIILFIYLLTPQWPIILLEEIGEFSGIVSLKQSHIYLFKNILCARESRRKSVKHRDTYPISCWY